ncbi:MAG: glutamate-1-semialdehyde 2,1-aminomutase [Chloroflexi bacterium]|nr:glutamate-1-semialdehyde 2,1-aminomutase [Chloroflexota bacterium]MBT5476929.1 glutamate-1-semialdehyde 2,1-aminomutase [Chloroflexota bacterium]MBT6707331.1 glutamate-1-semialdehyde 2,1-aminomutase [Chloroflexota bacterium]MBT7078993.1 glutamate-1-semialdehyde 2,1-aminomutase [Chloroflexota bacterium]MBT7833567.1 glutamate-1-semialdehyde 2,1-aminomutase [Chloroflexota bacterium]
MSRAKSAKLFSDAKTLIPGGVNSPARAWGSVGGDPIFFKRALGSRVWDADDNELIDYVCSWGPMILGHANPTVIDSAVDAARLGTSFGAPTELEVEMARRVVDAVPSIEVVRFVSSGTEATMSALRLARAKTGRNKILKFDGGYHGHEDALLVAAGSGLANQGIASSAGVHPDYAAATLVADFNDIESVRALLEANKGEIAAVIVEPIGGNMGVVPPAPGFLEGLRDLTTEHGSMLIFDEVITGFRVAFGGAQSVYGVTPDITCLGKIVGGGFPVGAYGASAEIMSEVSPLGPMYQAGTLSGNPVAMAAGIATLAELSKPGVYEVLQAKTDKLADGVLDVFGKAGVPAVVNRACGLMTVFFTDTEVTDMDSASATDREAFGAFFHGMIDNGVYLPPSQFEAWFVSTAHSEADIAETLERVARSLPS